MGDAGRPFDNRAMIAAAAVALVLVAVLVVLNQSQSNDGDVETAGRLLVDTGADRVVARQLGSASAGRQFVSPSLSEVELIEAPGPAEDGLALAEQGSDDPSVEVLESVEERESAEQNAEPDPDVAIIAAPPRPPTTLVTPETQAPSPATTNAPAPAATAPATTSVVTTSPPRPAPTVAPTTAAPRVTTTTAPRVTTTTVRTTTTTTTAPPAVGGRYTVAQVIDGTIGAGDGSNPNEEAPMGRHDASLFLPQGWNWAQGPTRNSVWGQLSSGQFTEWRCAVIPENGHSPNVPFRINVQNGAYYQFAGDSWSKAFDAQLDSPDHGGYLGQAGQLNSGPFSNGGHGHIEWRQEADGSYSAPWNANALMMHFWAGRRQSPASGQTAEFLTSEVRLQQPDGQTVDLSQVRVLFQCGIDYYNTTGGQGTRVPGPGIGKYHRVTTSWTPGLWVTLPGNVSANSTGDFRTWLEANLPPNVRP